MRIDFFVPGPPQGKARPRFGKGHTYTPEKTVNYERMIRASWKRAAAGIAPLDCPIWLEIVAYYPIPKSASKKRRAEMVKGNIRPTAKPDVDNVAKAVLDALNRVAYTDDSRVAYLQISKWYSDTPGIKVGVAWEPW